MNKRSPTTDHFSATEEVCYATANDESVTMNCAFLMIVCLIRVTLRTAIVSVFRYEPEQHRTVSYRKAERTNNKLQQLVLV